jgi:hypothetical protein
MIHLTMKLKHLMQKDTRYMYCACGDLCSLFYVQTDTRGVECFHCSKLFTIGNQ